MEFTSAAFLRVDPALATLQKREIIRVECKPQETEDEIDWQ